MNGAFEVARASRHVVPAFLPVCARLSVRLDVATNGDTARKNACATSSRLVPNGLSAAGVANTQEAYFPEWADTVVRPYKL